MPAHCTTRLAQRLCAIHFHHHRANTYRKRAGLHTLRYRWVGERHPALRGRILTYWVHVQAHSKRQMKAALAAARISSSTPWSAAWKADAMCIHSHEGAWNSDTGNGYHGGMQMDTGFEATYGSEFVSRYGNAENWPPHDQLLAAYRAYHGYHRFGARGWSPWPNTSAMCGL